MQMAPQLQIPIERVYVPVKRRKTLRPEAVTAIAESILDVGQQWPIVVRAEADRFVLMDGLHRLEACRALGETIIAAVLSTNTNLRKAAPVYETQAEAEREKMERLRNLRAEREAAESRREPSEPGRPQMPSRRPVERPTHGFRKGGKRLLDGPKNLSEWIQTQKNSGGRY
jgi:hypothetical protein